MPRMRFLRTITMNGSDLPKGHIDEIDDVSAKALIRDGHAELCEDVEDPAGDPKEDDPVGEVLKEDNVDQVRKALDAQYKRDALAEAAKAIDVQFPFDAKKADIVEAVIAAGKAEVLLK